MSRVTSFRIDERTAEILRILGIPFSKVVYRGLAALCIEKKITNPRIIQLIRRYYTEHVEDLEYERQLMEGILKAIETGEVDSGALPKVEEEIVRPEHLSQSSCDWLKTDGTYAAHVLRNIIASRLESNIVRYNGGDMKELIADLTLLKEDPGTDGVEREALEIIFCRSDLDAIAKAGLSQAVKYLKQEAKV